MLQLMTEKAKNLLEENKKAPVPEPKIKICVLGASGVGKTSVITSLYAGGQQMMEGSELYFAAQKATDRLLSSRHMEFKEMFDGRREGKDIVYREGTGGDFMESSLAFRFGSQAQGIHIHIGIQDYPGEQLISNPKTAERHIAGADAILLVIDTPCLMEEGGRFNEGRNRMKAISHLLMKHLPKDEEKLVFFVPVKCERYVHDGRIEEVNARICGAYGELLAYLRNLQTADGQRKSICCAITPVQTLGSVEFDSFERGSAGVKAVELEDGCEIPAGENYRFVGGEAAYAPKNAEQLLSILLHYFAGRYERMKEEHSESTAISRFIGVVTPASCASRFRMETMRLVRKSEADGMQPCVLFGKGRM